MKQIGLLILLASLGACSSDSNEPAALDSESSQREIDDRTKTIEEAANEAAALIEADNKATMQENAVAEQGHAAGTDASESDAKEQ